MTDDTLNPGFSADQAWGALAPPAAAAVWIDRAQSMPDNWLGKQIAQLVRRYSSSKLKGFYDVASCGVRLRSNFLDNTSERSFVFMPWRFDAAERDYVSRMLPRDGVFVDIGGNVGIYTLWAAKTLDAGGRILTFEPNPKALQRLHFNIDANQAMAPDAWPEIDVVQMGVADAATTFTLNFHLENLGGSSIVMHAGRTRSIEIQCTKLLDALTTRGIDHIDILKIDIEGAEDKALLPFFDEAPKSLWPGAIIIEDTSAAHWGRNPIDAIVGLGYKRAVKGKRNVVFALPGRLTER